MYKPVANLVNEEIIKNLLDLCNEFFISPMIQPYAGASRECMFCGTKKDRKGRTHHYAASCPVVKYLDIVEKHKRFIVEI